MESQYPRARTEGGRAQVDGFELVTAIGRGPRSEVWQARTKSGRDVALKIFLPHLCKSPSFVARFEKETAALAALNHPNVLPALDRGRAGDRYYAVFEWVRGGSLAELRGQALSPAGATRIALEICEALDYAHRRGLPHRNLVLENVFVDDRDRVRVADFGMSLLSGVTPVDGDPRADLQALGALLQLLVYGAERADGPPMSRTEPISPRLVDVLARALASRPSERFGRASEMALALRLASSSMSGVGEPHAARETVRIAVAGRQITVTLLSDASAENTAGKLAELEELLGSGGPWRLAYDLGTVLSLDDGVRALLQRLHVRHHRNLERIAFCSPRALVRASVLVLGGASKGTSWKSFAASGPMQAWLDRETTP